MKFAIYIRSHCNIKYISNLCKDYYYYYKNHLIIFIFPNSNLTLFAKNDLYAYVILHLIYFI